MFVFLLESIGITFLIGAVPPLRSMWTLTMLLVGLLIAYVFLLISLKSAENPTRRTVHEAVDEVAQEAGEARFAAARGYATAVRGRHVAEPNGIPRPVYNGLGLLDEGDRAHVVVRSARELNVARA